MKRQFGAEPRGRWSRWMFSASRTPSSRRSRLQVADLALSQSNVAYIEGSAEGYDQFSGTHLMTSTPADPGPREIAADAFGLDTAGNRVVWTEQLPGSNCLCPGQILAATFDDPTPHTVGPTAGTFGDFSADGDLVAQAGAQIDLRSLTTGAWHVLAPTDGARNVSIDGGWLTWDANRGEADALGQVFLGLPISEIPLD